MSTMPVEANVVLTADNSQYDQAMGQSTQTTNQFGHSVDSLGQKISNLTKSAGRKLLGISAADTATVTGLTAAYASYEKQINRLQSQAAILSKTNAQNDRLTKDYTGAVKSLRLEYGSTTAEAAKLVEVLSKVTNVRQSRGLQDLSKVFMDMSKATGESSEGLATSLTQLQRMMTGNVNLKTQKQYADQFTYLAAQTNTSAQSLIDFTTQLAPVGKALGMNEQQIAGYATAFTKAGADGANAANVFNKITSDLANSIASGSPELQHYANLIGVTSNQLRNMDKGEAVTQILETIQQMPDASVELNRLGLEGPRSLRSITALLNQGQLRQSQAAAQAGLGSGAAGKGAAAVDDINESLSKMRQEMQLTAESMTTVIGPVMTSFVDGMSKAADVMRQITEGPFGEFLQMIMGIIAPFTAGTGALLLFAGALMKLAGVFALFRSSASYGIREGFRGGGAMVRNPDGSYGPAGGGPGLGTRGEQLAQGGTWLQRYQYQGGQMVGSAFGRLTEVAGQGYLAGRRYFDPEYTPTPRRTGLMSYLAGGVGRGLETFVNPAFDQMRFADPTRRQQWLQREAPWIRATDQARLSGAMGAVGTERTNLETVRQAQEATKGNALATNQEREARLAHLKTIETETKARLADAEAAELEARQRIASSAEMTNTLERSTVGFRRFTEALGGPRGLAGGVIGGGLGLGRAGLSALGTRGGMMGAGMAAMMAQGGFGIESNALTFGAMGAAMGGGVPGAVAGAALGTIVDVKNYNKDLDASLSSLSDEAKDASKNGLGLSDLAKHADETQQNLNSLNKDLESTHPHDLVVHPIRFMESVKNDWEGWFGHSDVEERQKEHDDAVKLQKDTEKTVLDVAKSAGKSFSGTAEQRRQQMEDFMSSEGAQRLTAAGINMDDLVKARGKGGLDYLGMLARLGAPTGETTSALEKTAAGRAALTTPSAQQSQRYQQDVALFYNATTDVFQKLTSSGKSYLDIIRSTAKTQSNIGDENDRQYELQTAVQAQARQNLQIQMSTMTRAGAFQAQVGQFRAITSAPVTTAGQAAAVQQAGTDMATAIADQVNYFKNLLLQQDQYEKSRTRAEVDYNLQRSYALHDYNLQRSRAEDAFNRARNRAEADHARAVRRATFDFNLSRQRQEEDFNHSREVAAEQQAQQMYNIYERVHAQQTASASWLIGNAQDQLQRMQDQATNLDKLRGQGVSTQAIQQLDLTNPQNAQQLARLVTELSPQMVTQLNQVAGTLRVSAAKALVEDPSSFGWQETIYQYRKGRDRASEDFHRGMRRDREDFTRQLRQQKEDFDIMMGQQAEDFATGMNRQEDAYQKTMRRAAKDMKDMTKEIDMSMEDVLTKSVKRLPEHAATQAQQVLDSLQTLKDSVTPEAIALMQQLSDIFGFEYKVPKKIREMVIPNMIGQAQAQHQQATQADLRGGMAGGGVMPGYTPGRDVMSVPVSGGEAIMRPEWARAVGAGAIDAMNHAAKYGGFADGGMVDPDARVYMDGQPVSKITKAQLLLAEKLSRMNLDTIQGSWQPYSSYSGSSHMGPGVVDEGPGNFRTQYWLRRVGFAAWGRNFPGAATAGSGAHVHAVSLLDPGASGQSQIAQFYAGGDGLGGQDYGPNPGMIPGLRGMLGQFSALALAQDNGGGAAASPMITPLSSIIKRLYPKSEAAAAAMTGLHPLGPGMISTILNRMLKKRYAESLEGKDPHRGDKNDWFGEGAVFTGPQKIGVGEAGPEAVIPLNARGGEFMADVMARSVGLGASPLRGSGMSVYNARIDRSTNFTGPITVQANDPAELIHKLQSRQRVMALSRPSLTGSAA